MVILFIADIHIKLNTKNIPNNWALDRYNLLWKKVYKLCEKADILIIGGDATDKAKPSVQELAVLFDFLADIPIETYFIPGNHEMIKKDTTYLSLLKPSIKKLNPLVNIIDEPCNIKGLSFLPYTHLKKYHPEKNNFGLDSNILITHCRLNIPPYVKEEVPIEYFKHFDVVLMGDLHAHSNSQGNCLYPGSPFHISFHRKEDSKETGVILYDKENLEYSHIPLELPMLLRKTVSSEKEMVEIPPHRVIYELKGNAIDVSNVDNELLDKKIVEKNSEAILDLSNKSIEEELSLYLSKVIKLEGKQIDNVMKVHNDYGGIT